MSFLVLAATAAISASAVPHAAPAHSLEVQHRGAAYTVDYVTRVETRAKAIGISPPARTSSRRCILTAQVSVERRIQPAGGARAIATVLPGTRTFTQSQPGDCRRDDRQRGEFVAGKADAISDHVRELASADHHDTLAAIDAARDFAAK
ncbi:hypothetical protein [Novosphingobium sp. ST904]|uniref:hypothetical protein n=1 Tax=Novosphingobium sp. ST904 TaxID=1684385 RepID=UPI0006C8DC02|nr:hypothetical protein [Novosphingobium sp. ST904]KPH66414.1 hypothetical protein ADT71_06280 [Novosphingobium sp. ST904]TCM34467.1 hypothetical protein EDF59_11726 [Novosphingobium sp. ST904]